MTTATQTALQEIPLDQITPTDQNPRRIRDDDPSLQELADSIDQHGVLEPVLVRPMPDAADQYELRAGERRWRASRLADLDTIPAIVRDLDDREALQVTVTENLQREDLHPLEEARGIESLIDGGWQVKDVADHLGKSKRWVARRRRLTGLVDEWMDAAEDPDSPISNLPQGHLVEIAKYEPKTQRQIYEELGYTISPDSLPTLRRLKDLIGQLTHKMESAPWPMRQNIDSLQPACADCRKRSACNPLLFEGMVTGEKDVDRCLDPECWEQRLVDWVIWLADSMYEEYGNDLILLTDWSEANLPDKSELPCSLTRDQYGIREKDKDDDDSVPALVVCGRDMGEVKWVVDERRASSSSSNDGPRSWEDKHERLTGRRAAHVLDSLADIVEESEAPHNCSSRRLLCLACSYGVENRLDVEKYPDGFDRPLDLTEMHFLMQEQPDDVVDRLVWEGIKPALIDSLGYYKKTGSQERLPRAHRVCELMDVDFQELAAAAREAVPTPKSWPDDQDPDDFTSNLEESE